MTRKYIKTPKAPTVPPVCDENNPKLAKQTLDRREIARELLTPSTLAGNTIASLGITGDQTDVDSLIRALREQNEHVSKGDLSRAEAMLMSQATALDALFCSLTRRAVKQEMLHQYEVHFRLALRAQSQCRATLETLAAIKNPPPVLITKQANIAHGPQQVNNGPLPAQEASRARESQNESNRLLEQKYGERLDTHAAGAASGADPAMAPVGEVHGTEVRRG